MKSKYLAEAAMQSMFSKALNRSVGACLVCKGEIPIGSYNGPPRGIHEKHNWGRFTSHIWNKLWDHSINKFGYVDVNYCYPDSICKENHAHPKLNQDPRYLLGYKSGQGLKYQIDAHAEVNAIINAARLGISTIGSELYLTCPIPCTNCAIYIVQAGISNIYCLKSDLGLVDKEDDNDYNFFQSRWILKNGGVEVIEYEQDDMIKACNEVGLDFSRIGVGFFE